MPSSSDVQLPLFAGVAGLRAEEAPPDEPLIEPSGPIADSRQIDLFADRVVLARDLESAILGGRFEDAARIRLSLEKTYGPSETSQAVAPVDALAAAAWEGPPEASLAVWAEIDRRLATHPPLRDRVRTGAFTRLLETHSPQQLLAAGPKYLAALTHVLTFGGARPEQEGRMESRALVRDALLAGHALESLDFREDAPLSDLLAEDLPPRWLACLGRIRRLWPAPVPVDSEWEDLYKIARGDGRREEPALAFWQCLRVAENPGCPDELRHIARRRMKQLHPDLHALVMRRAGPTA